MTKKELYRRAQAHGAQRFSGDAEDGWIAGYKAARADLRKEVESRRAADGFLSYGSMGMAAKEFLKPIR